MGGGGAEKVLVDLVNSLNHNKYKVDVVSVTGGVHESRLSPHVNYHKMIKTENKFLKELLTRIIYHLPFSLVYKLVKKDEYDIEIAYIEGFPTRVIAAGRSKAKKLAFVHCDISNINIIEKVYRNSKECIQEYAKFDKVSFVSKAAEEGFFKVNGKIYNSVIVHNVVDVEAVKKKSLEKNDYEFSTKRIKLITVGRLTEQKSYDRLIEIAAEIEKNFDFEIWILGEGEQRAYLEKLIVDLDVKSVKLLGFKNNPYCYMKKADMFVCSSLFEGYSTVITEAVILGLPIITTDCAGMDEILENGTYGIITENTKEGLKNGLIKVMENREFFEKYKRIALIHSENYSNDNAIKEYEDLFKELLS